MLLKKKIAPEKASKQKSILFYYCWWWDESTEQVWKLSSAIKKGRAFRRSGQGINTPNSIQGVPTPDPYSRPWIPIFVPLDPQGWSKALCSFQVCHLSGMRTCSWREKACNAGLTCLVFFISPVLVPNTSIMGGPHHHFRAPMSSSKIYFPAFLIILNEHIDSVLKKTFLLHLSYLTNNGSQWFAS